MTTRAHATEDGCGAQRISVSILLKDCVVDGFVHADPDGSSTPKQGGSRQMPHRTKDASTADHVRLHSHRTLKTAITFRPSGSDNVDFVSKIRQGDIDPVSGPVVTLNTMAVKRVVKHATRAALTAWTGIALFALTSVAMPSRASARTKVVSGILTEVSSARCFASTPAGAPAATPQALATACSEALIGIEKVTTVPGMIFIGGAFGSKSSQFIIAPGLGANVGASFPLVRPTLAQWPAPTGQIYTLPSAANFNMNLIVAGSFTVGSLIFPDKSASRTTEVGWSLGALSALEFAWTSWDTEVTVTPAGAMQVNGTGKAKFKLALSIGMIVGYLQSDLIGDALIVGGQPNISLSL